MIRFVFIHGFLGRPEDADVLHRMGLNFSYELTHIDLEAFVLNSYKPSFSKFSTYLSTLVTNSAPHVLVGYSLGARLALYSLCAVSSPYAGAICFSPNPGLVSAYEKKERLKKDLLWADRFFSGKGSILENWDDLCQDWESQPVFANTVSFTGARDEYAHNRQALSKMMKVFSLGKQKNLGPCLTQLQKPVLWLCGEHDEKFCKLGSLAQKQNTTSIRFSKIKNAGHRVCWDQPLTCGLHISQWLSKLSF